VRTLKLASKRAGILGGVVAAAAAIGAIAASGVGFAATAVPAAKSVVIVSCADKAQVRPSGYVIACGDGNDALSGLHWVSWKNVAFGSGTEELNGCEPSCAAGKIYKYPVLITLWRARSRPHHPGQQYFSRITLIHTGALTRPRAAKVPLTFTQSLAANYP
jgi:hypothetical protein